MNDKFLADVLEYLSENIKLFRKLFRQQYQDLHGGSHTLTDREHAKWFMMKAMANPNWVRALPYVEGGMAEAARFQRTMGLNGNAEF